MSRAFAVCQLKEFDFYFIFFFDPFASEIALSSQLFQEIAPV
jgi:hypothetical protein